MKQVIFVGGTAYSGSTFLQFALANDPHGFAAGEIAWLFRPRRADHINRPCSCRDANCTVWREALKHGEAHVYQTIFDRFPEVEFIVDSSKHPFWIRTQADRLAKQGIQSRHLLIWKTPLEFAHSMKKRNQYQYWRREWINYHRLYMTLMDEWGAVQYSQLTKELQAFQKVCTYLDLPYFPSKEEYWNRSYHALGGNYSARFHLYNEEVAKEYLVQPFNQERMNVYRRVFYTEVEDSPLAADVKAAMAESHYWRDILEMLGRRDIVCPESENNPAPAVQLSMPELGYRQLKDLTRNLIGKVRYGASITAA